MIEINLLPWREQTRKQRQKNQRYLLLLSFIVTFVIAMLTKQYFSQHDTITIKPVISHAKNTFPNIRYVGYLSQGKNKLALIMLPQGEVQDVQQGSYIEKNSGKILSINPSEIIIQMPNRAIRKVKMLQEGLI